MDSDDTPPPFNRALGFWLKLGLISFGGPAGQIAVMHTELVERRRWLDHDGFMRALNLLHAAAGAGGPSSSPRTAAGACMA